MTKLYLKDLSEDIVDAINEEENFEPDLKVIELGDWSSNDKYDYKTNIFQYKNKFYTHDSSRSGSYFTDYETESDDFLTEVQAVPKTIIVYEPI